MDPTTEDVAAARPFVSDQVTRTAALRIIASKGTAKDADDLIDIARSSFGADRRLALEGVQRLTTDKLEAAGHCSRRRGATCIERLFRS